MKRTTNLVIISGPSGSGKDAVIEGLIKKRLPIERIISTTSRAMRKGESEGNPYYFIDKKTYQNLIDEDKLAEYKQVDNDEFYGVTKTEFERVKNSKDKIGIWKIDYKGVQDVKTYIPDIPAILIEPPDVETLVKRSRARGQQSETEIQERIEYSKEFLKHKDLYDYSVVNEEGKLNKTIDKVAKILKKEGLVK